MSGERLASAKATFVRTLLDAFRALNFDKRSGCGGGSGDFETYPLMARCRSKCPAGRGATKAARHGVMNSNSATN